MAEAKDEARPGVLVVTSGETDAIGTNFDEHADQTLGITTTEAVVDAEENLDPEAAAKAEQKKIDDAQAIEDAKGNEPKEGDVDGSKVFFKGKWVGKHDFNYRLHLKTEETRKESDAKIAAADAKAKTEREAREKAEQTAAELKAKYEPPKSQEQAPEPLPGDFADVGEYAKALKEWTADNTRREDAAKANAERMEAERKGVITKWNERETAIKAEIADYETVVSASEVKVSNELRDAILESEVGPRLRYHLATHPDVAESLAGMTVSRMLREVGKIEATLGSAEKPQPKSEERPAPKIAEVSKAPPPITPLKGGNSVAGLKIDSNGEWTGTPEEFKAARLAGKIK